MNEVQYGTIVHTQVENISEEVYYYVFKQTSIFLGQIRFHVERYDLTLPQTVVVSFHRFGFPQKYTLLPGDFSTESYQNIH